MRRLLRVASLVLMAIGIVWILQGVGTLPGSFMTGQSQWAWYGVLAVGVGVVLRLAARR